MTQITFQQLKKLSKTDASALPQYSLAVLGDCATQHLATALRGYGVSVGIRLNVFDADYDQIDAQVMAPDSELYRFSPGGAAPDVYRKAPGGILRSPAGGKGFLCGGYLCQDPADMEPDRQPHSRDGPAV